MKEPQITGEDVLTHLRDRDEPRLLSGILCEHVASVRTMISQMVLNEADADDLTQEVFLRAIRGIRGFQGKSQLSTWLHRIAMNTVRSFLRSRNRPQPASGEALLDRVDLRAFPPEQLAIADEFDNAITAAMGSLPPALRAAVVLTMMQGLGVREAARIEGCAAATMYWRMHKARKILKKRLEKYLT